MFGSSAALVLALITGSVAGGSDEEAIVPVDARMAPLRVEGLEYPEAASYAARKVIARIDRLDQKIVSSAYSHRLSIDVKAGRFDWDCSAMVNWVLRRAAPKAYAALDRDRPVAVSYVRTIAAAPKHKARNGWRELRGIQELQPGDVFAWRRPPDFASSNTGHVGFVLSAPKAVEGWDNAWWVRIVDASRYTHRQDTRDPGGDGGFGAGTLVFVTDDEGRPVAYGWRGNPQATRETEIVFGRVVG